MSDYYFFGKTGRAKSRDDAETWAGTEVAATLNGFDNTGSVRATTLIIFYGNRVADIRFQKDVINTLQARMGTGGNNMPLVLVEEDDMQKNQNIIGTLQARDYKGVGNQYVEENKLVVEKPIAFDTQFGSNATTFEDLSPTLKASQQPPSFLETDGQMIATPIHDKATRYSGKRKLHNGEYATDGAGNGLGIGKEGEPMNTLTGGDRHAVGTGSQVRRLTPLECERLQGFPEDWTAGQADSSRYKQMGNAVAVPVVEWVIGRLVKEHMQS